MGRYKKRVMIFTLGALVSLAACVTVNVYFPEKDVKSAYKDLEDELVQPADDQPPDRMVLGGS